MKYLFILTLMLAGCGSDPMPLIGQDGSKHYINNGPYKEAVVSNMWNPNRIDGFSQLSSGTNAIYELCSNSSEVLLKSDDPYHWNVMEVVSTNFSVHTKLKPSVTYSNDMYWISFRQPNNYSMGKYYQMVETTYWSMEKIKKDKK